MRRFSSYGPIDPEEHYHAPRKDLIAKGVAQLIGENPRKGGHYITVWAPRQCGKTWVMQEVVQQIKQSGQYHVGIFSLESVKEEKDIKEVLTAFVEEMAQTFQKELPAIKRTRDILSLFTKEYFQKPVILIIDEFDSLEENFINKFAGVFRDMFIKRTNEKDRQSRDKTYLLHGLALIGVRSVLGIENVKGSPFNTQKSLHVPNLTYDEVNGMFQWYTKESGQEVDPKVIAALYDETRGQPGLTCWFGELITDKYNRDKDNIVGIENFEETYAAAIHILPNNNIINIISKADKPVHRETVLELFKTGEKMIFSFDDKSINYLYMNGVIDEEKEGRTGYYVRFSSPFVQKRLFYYFSSTIFKQMGQLVKPFLNLDPIIDATRLDVRELMKLYQSYLDNNRSWLFKDAPRRSDLRIYEAVFHFNLYAYLDSFLRNKDARVFPEFPTGNGKIDLLIRHNNITYGIELKSYTDQTAYRRSLEQAALYGKQLGLSEIFLVIFVEAINEQNRNTYETVYRDQKTAVSVNPIFITTGG
ncbi:MAG: ATP-binding protein [bacterium]|nr:ATP-binding protein [bacterium]